MEIILNELSFLNISKRINENKKFIIFDKLNKTGIKRFLVDLPSNPAEDKNVRLLFSRMKKGNTVELLASVNNEIDARNALLYEFDGISTTINLDGIEDGITELTESLEYAKYILDIVNGADFTLKKVYIDSLLNTSLHKYLTVKLIESLLYIGYNDIVIMDGKNTPLSVFNRQLDNIVKHIKPDSITMHIHDVNKLASAKLYTCIEHGIRSFDSSIAGLGFDMATELIIDILYNEGIKLDIKPDKVNDVAKWVKQNIKSQL